MEQPAIQLTFFEDAPAYLRGEQMGLEWQTVEVKLTKGKTAIIDACNYDLNEKYSYHCTYGGYAARGVRDKRTRKMTSIYLHNEVLERKLGRKLKRREVADHINNNKLDNRECNLRAVSEGMNNHNTPARSNSGCKGVSWVKSRNKWVVFIRHNHQMRFYGVFTDKESACAKAAEVYRKLYGEHARTD